MINVYKSARVPTDNVHLCKQTPQLMIMCNTSLKVMASVNPWMKLEEIRGGDV